MIALYSLIFVVALLCVIKGGDLFVDSSITLAKRSKIPTIIIGATIVSLATTLPELIVSCIASSQGSYDLAVGNAVGSVICNTALIAGLSMTFLPVAMKEKTSPLKYILLILSAILIMIFGFDKDFNFSISWRQALIIELIFVFYILFISLDAVKQHKLNKSKIKSNNLSIIASAQNQANSERIQEIYPKLIVSLAVFVFGAILVALGAWGLVESAKYLCSAIGINESIVGLTIVAIGTSLPELITTINSIRKKNSELGFGNIVGANIMNLTLLIGSSGLISGNNGLPISFWTYLVSISLTIVTCLIFVLPLWIKQKSYRWQGIVLLSVYMLYLIFLIFVSCMGFAL